MIGGPPIQYLNRFSLSRYEDREEKISVRIFFTKSCQRVEGHKELKNALVEDQVEIKTRLGPYPERSVAQFDRIVLNAVETRLPAYDEYSEV